MRRRIWGLSVVLLSVVLALAGCFGGKKDAGAVVKDLDSQVEKLESYTSSGTMTLHTGTEPQEYQVEVSFQKPSYYRISLSNDKKDISQIVLKNDDGVFVLTPHLNKSFRFQSDWPKNQGQVYLYESLVNSINQDKERQFTTDGDSYVFDVLANYSNSSLSRQKIWINKKSFAPQTVEIYDAQNKPVVVMNFNDFKFNETFEKDYFDMQRNMTSARITLPTMGLETQQGKAAAQTGTIDQTGKGTAQSSGTATQGTSTQGTTQQGTVQQGTVTQGKTQQGAAPVQGNAAAQQPASSAAGTTAVPQSQGISLIEPSYIPTGVGKPKASETMLGENAAILLKYTGNYNYTLLESRPSDKSVSYQEGELVDLGYSFGVLTGGEKKTLLWMAQGTEFRLSSGDLPVDEMVQIAISVQGMSGK
ncbi:MAG: rane protein [Paenibacillaceae bacterium]|jgi:outer membrane lipoprotein-sorting protein|nr:rane protein [Paenibacillaceae bacterium]